MTREITFLGRVYSELPTNLNMTKLFLLGECFNCFEECLIIGTIFQQPKPIFRPNSKQRPRDVYQFFKLMKTYDDGENSDAILQMNLYKAFEKRFLGTLSDLKNLRKIKRELRGGYGEGGNRERHNLRFWCYDNFVTERSMWEVAETKRDMMRRLERLNVTQNEKIMQDHKIGSPKELYLRIKFALAGAFLPQFFATRNLITPAIEKDIHNVETNLKMDSHCTVVLSKSKLGYFMRDNTDFLAEETAEKKRLVQRFGDLEKTDVIKIWDNLLKNMIEKKYGKIEKYLHNYKDQLIMFEQESAREALQLI